MTTNVSTEKWARAEIVGAFRSIFGRAPTLTEAQFAQAVSRGESYYGMAAYRNRADDTSVSNTWNMGSVQCGTTPPCPPGCFEATDSHSGSGDYYQACFRSYSSPEAGFEHFVRVLYTGQRAKVLAAARDGDIANFSATLRASHYFELPLAQHIKGMTTNLRAITTALHEPMPSSLRKTAFGVGALALGIVGAVVTIHRNR